MISITEYAAILSAVAGVSAAVFILEPWIMALRKEKGDETFGEHFQNLYEKTIDYMKKALTTQIVI